MTALGSKAEGLTWLERTFSGTVPAFIAVPIADLLVDGEAWLASAQTAMDVALASGDTAQLREVAQSVEVDTQEVRQALAGVTLGPHVAVRTSALSEDGADHSFAGQYETVLDVPLSEVAAAVAVCARSLVSERLAAYARHAGVGDRATGAAANAPSMPVGGSVVIQTMAPRGTSGVMFTQNSRGDMEIAYSTAGPDAVVSGEDAQQFTWPATEPLPRRAPVPRELLRLGRDIQAARGAMDVEFAFARGKVFLLQARPLTADRTPKSLTWDSSNIGENYPGVTLPLTYSFIREVYAEVYPAFFRLLGRKDRDLRAHQAVFRNTLGYVRGGVHYQIDNWFEMAAMLPGGRTNQEFFSAMLQPVKDGEVRERPRPGLRGALPIAAGLVRFAVALADSERRSRKFRRQFEQRYRRYRAIDFDRLTTDAALAALTHIRTDLLALWAVPILNDVRLMVWHGLLARRYGPDRRSEYLAFLSGLTDRASIAPLEGLAQLGTALTDHGVTSASEPLEPHTRALVDEYLAHYGGRAPDELQLENPRLADDHSVVVSLALAAATNPPRSATASAIRGDVTSRLIGRQVRRAIDHRERFRFNRAQVFGIARDCYVSIGRRFTAEGALTHAEDIFWLTVDEIDAAVYGHAWDTDLQQVVDRRRERLPEHQAWERVRRVTSASEVAGLELTEHVSQGTADLAGAGVSPGLLQAPAVVLTEFDAHADVTGKVLVAPHADPGWTLLIVSAAAVVTERGNALSHVAIVGRELGIPVVVGAEGATSRLATGDMVYVDGTAGEIHVRTP